ncbi:MAG: UbiH/UbiF family hydroxylase [Hyphomicrobiales bacterium]|nr:MAG: UbiH/UbiF family hydroxylase [Hyphomicrobiales bacterium]
MSLECVDIIVVGAGPAGLVVALCLARHHQVALVGPPEAGRPADRRTTALLGASVDLLENIGVWEHLGARATPLDGIRIVDDRKGLLRAPELTFRAAELGIASFGANVENQDLVRVLLDKVARTPAIRRIEGTVTAADLASDKATIRLEDARGLEAPLIIAADGRNSLIRKASGIGTKTWSYPQSALAVSFSHSREHGGVSTELHRRHGPLTVVPLAGRASSLVWVERPEEATRLAELPDAQLAHILETELQGLLGSITRLGHRGVFPLSGLTADTMGSHRVALVGEAAHVMPPIGAQGLNLGFRDAAALAEIVDAAAQAGTDIGSDDVLQRYDRARMSDIRTRQMSVDALNHSLVSDFLPVQALRGTGLHLLAHLKPLREAVMRAGMGPATVPRLMQRLSA